MLSPILSRILRVSVSLLLALSLACAGSAKSKAKKRSKYDPNVARYRLLLRANPVDPGEAFRCHGGCQELTAPDEYLGCLTKCPAFEVTQGYACAPVDVPPVAACITARRLNSKDEIPPGFAVIGVIANIALIAALVSVSAPNSNGYYFVPTQPGGPF